MSGDIESPRAQVIGPVCTLNGEAHQCGANSYSGPPMAQNLQAWTTFKSAPISQNKITPFSQNEIAPFSQNMVISKITFLIN